jgi:hypothetical protein
VIDSVHVENEVPLMSHERSAAEKRLKQIEVALGHRRSTTQLAALIRERAELERKLVAPQTQGDG